MDKNVGKGRIDVVNGRRQNEAFESFICQLFALIGVLRRLISICIGSVHDRNGEEERSKERITLRIWFHRSRAQTKKCDQTRGLFCVCEMYVVIAGTELDHS